MKKIYWDTCILIYEFWSNDDRLAKIADNQIKVVNVIANP